MRSRRPRNRLLLAGLATLAAASAAALTPLVDGVAGAAAFGAPVVVSGDNASEPGIDVAPDGTLYVNAPVGVLSNIPGSPSNVYRSSDGGAAWAKLPAGLQGHLPRGRDPHIAIP